MVLALMSFFSGNPFQKGGPLQMRFSLVTRFHWTGVLINAIKKDKHHIALDPISSNSVNVSSTVFIDDLPSRVVTDCAEDMPIAVQTVSNVLDGKLGKVNMMPNAGKAQTVVRTFRKGAKEVFKQLRVNPDFPTPMKEARYLEPFLRWGGRTNFKIPRTILQRKRRFVL